MASNYVSSTPVSSRVEDIIYLQTEGVDEESYSSPPPQKKPKILNKANVKKRLFGLR